MGPLRDCLEAWETETFFCPLPEIEVQFFCHPDRRLVSKCINSPIPDHKKLIFVHKTKIRPNSAKRIYIRKYFSQNVIINVHGSVHRNNILIYIQQGATLHSLLYLETALHVSGGTSTHHRERIQLYLQHLVFFTPLLLSAAIVEELELV